MEELPPDVLLLIEELCGKPSSGSADMPDDVPQRPQDDPGSAEILSAGGGIDTSLVERTPSPAGRADSPVRATPASGDASHPSSQVSAMERAAILLRRNSLVTALDEVFSTPQLIEAAFPLSERILQLSKKRHWLPRLVL